MSVFIFVCGDIDTLLLLFIIIIIIIHVNFNVLFVLFFKCIALVFNLSLWSSRVFVRKKSFSFSSSSTLIM